MKEEETKGKFYEAHRFVCKASQVGKANWAHTKVSALFWHKEEKATGKRPVYTPSDVCVNKQIPIHNVAETVAFYLSRTFTRLRLEYPRGIYQNYFSPAKKGTIARDNRWSQQRTREDYKVIEIVFFASQLFEKHMVTVFCRAPW